jgi:AcrR family transcriptional regulator
VPRVLTANEVADFRERLCELATRRFAEQGTAGVTLRGLADEAGCSRTTPYRYFKDKAEILAAVRAAGFKRLADAVEEAARAERDPRRRLEALGRTYLRFAREEPHAYRVMYEISQQDEHRYPELVKQIQRSQQPMLDTVEDCVRAGVVHGDPLNVVHVLWAGLHGLNTLHLADKLHLGRDVDELSEVMVKSLGRAVASDPSPRPAARRPTHRQEETS